jgi:NTE family protein
MPDRVPTRRAKTPGIVLSGGGMRGAYEAGVIAGLMEALGRKPDDPALFRVLSGTSVGAINATYLAANSHLGDHGIFRLLEFWKSLRLETHVKLRLLGLMRWPKRVTQLFKNGGREPAPGSSLLDTGELERLVSQAIDFEQLRENVQLGRIRALLVAALHVVSGRTTVFAEIAPDAAYYTSPTGPRISRVEPITIDHVLASAAIPLLFPTRRVGERFYCDGGLRFNTPIAPAIRAGADPLLIVSVSHKTTEAELPLVEREHAEAEGMDLGPLFLIGKLLNALLLDPVKHDLLMLSRLNDLVEVLESMLSQEEFELIQSVLVKTRGARYRRLGALVFSPSRDIGRLAGEHLRGSVRARRELNPLLERLLARAAREGMSQEADWASYLLFDGAFAEQLIELGRSDALARADEICAIFGD